MTSLGWGLSWPAVRAILVELPPLYARGMAGLAAALFFAVLARAMRQRLALPRGAFGRVVLAAAINVFAWMGFATLAMRWLTVGQCALLVYTMPAWVVLLAWPVLGQRPSPREVGGLVLCAVGLLALFGRDALAFDGSQWLGALLALGSASCCALGTVAVRPVAGVPPMTLLAWQLALGCAPMLALGVAFERPAPLAASATTWWLWLYMAAVSMGLCYLGWFEALRRLPPATASIATLVTPVIGIGSAAWLLGEALGVREGVALVLTMCGVALALPAPKEA